MRLNLVSIFNRRANVLRAISYVLKGPYVSAVRTAIREALEARVGGNELKLTRAWKLFLLLPLMLLFRPPRGGKIPKLQLLERLQNSRGASGVNWSKKEQFWQREAQRQLQEETEAEGRCSTPRTQGFAVCVGWGIVCSATSFGRCRDSTWDRENLQSVDESVEAPERAEEPFARLGQDPRARRAGGVGWRRVREESSQLQTWGSTRPVWHVCRTFEASP